MSIDRNGLRPAAAALHDLPVFAPDPQLQARVLRARQMQLHERNRSRRRRVGWAALAAMLAAAVVAWPQFLANPSPGSATIADMAGDLRESQALEAQWRQLGAGHGHGGEALARVRLIDANLQAAYDRGADERELQPLWQRRNAVLRALIDRSRDADSAAPTVVMRL